MANILGLALKVTGDASGLAKSLTPVDRALDNLAKQADRATAVFTPFAEKSAAAAKVQEDFAAKLATLAQQLKDTVVGPQEYAAAFAQLSQEAKAAANAFDEGLKLTEANRTAEEKRAATLQRLDELYELGAIDLRTYNAEAMKAAGVNEQIAQAEAQRAEAGRRAAQIIESNLTTMERAERNFAAGTEEANSLRKQGLLTDEQHSRQIQKLAGDYAKATVEAGKLANQANEAAKQGLKFNEVSGILSALPGPIGNVAGRLSGLASASEGLSRIFAGGLAAGASTLGTSLLSLVNPVTATIAAIAGLGAAATSVVRGLTFLEKETEQLQNAADKLGVSFAFMQTLREAADMTGVSFETVNSAMTKLLKTLAGADEESKQATAALNRLGVQLDDLNGLNSEQQLRLIADRLTAIEDPAKRAAAATAIFGKSGAEILPFLRNLEAADQTLTLFNARLSEVDVARIMALGDSFDAVKASISGVTNEVLTPFIGITQSVADGLASAFATFGRNIGALLDALSPVTSAIGLASNIFLQFGSILGNIVGTVLEPFATAGRTIASVFDAMSRTTTAVAGRINEAVIGFREFFKFDAVARGFGDAFNRIAEVVSRVTAIVAKFAEVGIEALGRVATIAGEAIAQFLEFTGLDTVISTITETIGTAFGTLWDTIRGIVSGIGGFIERVLKFAEEWLGIVPKIEQPVVATVEFDDGGAIAEILRENKDFQTTLNGITKSVSDAINESQKFGQAGFDAALKYQTAIQELKDQLDRGLFNEETFRREAEKAGVAFKAELARIEENNQLDLQINADAEKTLAGIQQKISGAVTEAMKFGEAGQQAAVTFQDKLRDLGAQFERGILNQTALDAEIAKATEEYNKQIEGLKQIEQLQAELLKQDRDRVAQLLAEGNTQTQLEQDIATVLREQARLETELATARENGAVMQADAAAARLAQLDQLQAKLDDQQQAVEQGFGEGFTKAFEQTNKGIDSLIDKAEQFGNVGALAAQALQAGIERAQQQVRDGILTKETYETEVARQQDLFSQRLAAATRVEEFLRAQLTVRQQAELDAVKALEERQKQAAVNVQAIEAKIIEEKKKLEQARENNNLKDARSAQARINQLEAARRAEDDLANGRQRAQGQQAGQQLQGFTRVQQFQTLIAQQNTNFLRSFQNTYQGANAALAAANAAAEAQAAKLQQILTPGPRTVQGTDIRTAEGAALVLGLAANEQDPALIEARLQTKQLVLLRQAVLSSAQSYLNTPVEIL